MTVGVDISQIAHEGTGVATYVRKMVMEMVRIDRKNRYILFGYSLRKLHVLRAFYTQVLAINPTVLAIFIPIPPSILEIVWNRLHILPIQTLVGSVDVFWSSDWTQPPLHGAFGITTIHDVTFLRYPESFPPIIRQTQMRRIAHAIRECSMFMCDSVSTQEDFISFYHVPKKKTVVVYPGVI